MGRLFNYDAPFWRGMNKVADVIILNVLTILSCIPIITAGAAVTALYDAMWKLVNDEGSVWRNYWSAFKSNFKQATVIWLFVAVTAVIAWYSFLTYFVNGMTGKTFMMVLAGIPVLVWGGVTAWVFPLQSRFYNKVHLTFRNAFLCSIAYLPRTLGMIVLNLLPAALFLIRLDIFMRASMFLIIGYFGLAAYLNTLLLRKPFNKLIDQAEGTSEEEKEESTKAIEE